MSHARMSSERRRVAPLVAITALLISACGGAAAPASTQTSLPAAATTAPAAEMTSAPAATNAVSLATESASGSTAAASETASSAASSATQAAAPPAAQATGVPDIQCQPGQKEVVWMVRNSPVENPWESQVVRPAFMKAYPKLCLRIYSINQDDVAVKREAMIASGDPLHVWSPSWGGDGPASDRVRGLLEDLTPFIQRDNFDMKNFLPGTLNNLQINGKTYGLPFGTSGSYVYYNKKLFDEAKVPYPPVSWDDKSWTWDKFVATAKQLTKNPDDISKAQYGAIANVINGDLDFPPMVWGHDIWPAGTFKAGMTDHVIVDDPKSIQAYQAFHDLVFKDKVAPDPSAVQALDQLGGAFAAGRVAMNMDGGWGMWTYTGLISDPHGFCWGIAPIPWGSADAKERAVIFSNAWSMTSHMKPEDQEAAWTLIKFLLLPEQQVTSMKATGKPPADPRLTDQYYQQYRKCMDPKDLKQVFEGAYTHGRDSSDKTMIRWDELNQIWSNNLSQFFTDPNGKAADILPTIGQQTDQALKRIKQEQAK